MGRDAFGRTIQELENTSEALKDLGSMALAAGKIDEHSVCSAQQLTCDEALMTLRKLDGRMTDDEFTRAVQAIRVNTQLKYPYVQRLFFRTPNVDLRK